MDDTTVGKHRERTERDGDRAPAPREVEAHMTRPAATDDAETAADRRRDALRDADRARRAAEAGGERGLVERVVDRIRGRDNG